MLKLRRVFVIYLYSYQSLNTETAVSKPFVDRFPEKCFYYYYFFFWQWVWESGPLLQLYSWYIKEIVFSYYDILMFSILCSCYLHICLFLRSLLVTVLLLAHCNVIFLTDWASHLFSFFSQSWSDWRMLSVWSWHKQSL